MLMCVELRLHAANALLRLTLGILQFLLQEKRHLLHGLTEVLEGCLSTLQQYGTFLAAAPTLLHLILR